MGVPEDPVTGSAQLRADAVLVEAPGQDASCARWQASPRGGDLLCTDEGDRVTLSGPCALYMRGEIEV